VFIQTLSVEDVLLYRQQLTDHSLLPNQWISVPITLPIDELALQKDIQLLAGIFNYSIAGKVSFESALYEPGVDGLSPLYYPSDPNYVKSIADSQIPSSRYGIKIRNNVDFLT
jgi:hypothetical protein